ncbi:exodeoxyribonuclease VII large subunit [Ferrimonas balearica]|uniref:exodeoxyribonuclease VII large subunit n=1 Tax=Ferrimonas balearica TaxID=44012 RepID=UPI001C99EF52|nr:exodeoxyribonuclease VII large subunit [Ferrimonas balearica]MBY5922003.1 exodeoxyribonuclease VII large subunit [Ferrimonas balearica]MBY5994657.1 exodeoxyribonuclease VII large subunit [Ferrimonas balearica]
MSSSNAVYTVSALNRQIKALLEQQWGRVWLSGEISNLAMPASGHWYFTLKDDRSQLRCAMFKSRTARVGFRPEHGMQVLVRANLTMYEPRGDLQLVVESMQPAGDGLLQQRFEALKMQLASEGLFAMEAKQPLPHPIKRLGVITSPSGAAIQDVLSVLKRRDPMLEVIVYPTQVQGAEATAQICQAIQTVNARNEVDAILLTRGGGSLEDLWCFNEEAVARAIYHSMLPIVSAVGHEVDTTIADYVADLRAPTPSAAAELLSQDAGLRLDRLGRDRQRLAQAMVGQLRHQRQRLALLATRLNANHPSRKLEQHAQRLDELSLRLDRAMASQLGARAQKVERLEARLNRFHPTPRLAGLAQQLTGLDHRLNRAMSQHLHQSQLTLAGQVAALEAVSPLAVLSRGYSILQDEQGQTIKSTEQVEVGQRLTARLHQGSLGLQITDTE